MGLPNNGLTEFVEQTHHLDILPSLLTLEIAFLRSNVFPYVDQERMIPVGDLPGRVQYSEFSSML